MNVYRPQKWAKAISCKPFRNAQNLEPHAEYVLVYVENVQQIRHCSKLGQSNIQDDGMEDTERGLQPTEGDTAQKEEGSYNCSLILRQDNRQEK